MTRTRLRLTNFSMAVLLALAVAPALGQKPTIEMLPFPDEGVVAQDVCEMLR